LFNYATMHCSVQLPVRAWILLSFTHKMWNEILPLVAIDQLYFLLQSFSSCIHRLYCKKGRAYLGGYFEEQCWFAYKGALLVIRNNVFHTGFNGFTWYGSVIQPPLSWDLNQFPFPSFFLKRFKIKEEQQGNGKGGSGQ